MTSCTGVVLLYHRISTSDVDPWALAVTPGHFAEHLEALGRIATFVGLRDIIDYSGRSVPLRVAVSFDDGYADNLHTALPILERFDVPATFHIPTGAVDSSEEFWWDAIERVVLTPDSLPQRFVADNGEVLELGVETDRRSHVAAPYRDWRAWEVPQTPRHVLFVSLWQRCRELAPDAQGRFLDHVRGWAGVENSRRESHRTLTVRELQRLAASPLAAIGAHTRNHVRLSAWPREVQRREIQASRDDLRALGLHAQSFAYPFGGPSDYSQDSVEEVRRARFAVACANRPGRVEPDGDPLQLPRVFVQDWDGDELLRQLHGVVGGL